MNKIIAFLCVFCLFGCASQSATEKLSVTAKETISAVEKTLKPECKTEETMILLNNANSTIENMLTTCEQEKEVLEIKVSNRNLIIGAEGLLIVLFVVLFLRKFL